jgi:hypothetical protein
VCAQLRADIRPKGSCLQLVVDEDILEPIKPPGLDRQHRGADPLLEDGHGLDAQRTAGTVDVR